ncbi:two-component regulator propeller domain-containing protein [Aquimarina addita]|uniref:Two-component regulator propeller domain-containing protein n=1 Tax=Aquimarina addita TaxID=870485 RepID=A0ABP7XBP1_9FLAO
MQYFKVIVFIIFPIILSAQDFTNQWTGHFSYNEINDLYASENKVYAASENAVFIYDSDTKTTEQFSTIQGLSGETISAIYHSTVFDITVIGYDNGLIELLIDDQVRTFIDIVEKATIPPIQKRINHFYENQDILFIATEFGIVEFNLSRIEFGDTFFVGPGGSQINITGITISNELIYASTIGNGILSASENSTNLVDFNQWSTEVIGNFNGITSFGDQVLVWQDNTTIKSLENNTLTTVITAPSAIQDMQATSESLLITTADRAIHYDSNLQETNAVQSTDANSFNLNTSTLLGETIYLGTENNGLLEVANTLTPVTISPEGPLLNTIFGLEAFNDNLWVVFGEYDINYNPFPLQQQGISKLTANGWTNISKDDVLGVTSLTHITINPANEEQVFISSYQDGLLEINDNLVTNLYNTNNSGFETLVSEQDVIRLNGSTFDNNGNLWINNSRVDNGLKRFSPESGEVLSVDTSSLIRGLNLGFSDTVIDANGNVFFGGYSTGVIGYNSQTEELIQLYGEAERSNLPDDYVLALEVDLNNQLWIGTFQGLRVVFNPTTLFQGGTPQTNQIIILDDEGVPQELLFNETITDIEADGSNNKWVATASSGVFYFSSDGQETLAHFTQDNSPLPTNNIRDISVDDSTGSVYFGTDKGLLEYKGTATGPENNLNNVVAFPNPVRPGFSGDVTIRGLTSRANVKITDIEGNLVYEEISEGGSIQWDTTAFGRHRVASGVYLILVTAEDQAETTVSKLLIVR